MGRPCDLLAAALGLLGISRQADVRDDRPPPESQDVDERQVGGSHYLRLGDHQPWQVKEAWYGPTIFGYQLIGEAVSYLARVGHKGSPRENVEKTVHVLQKWLEVYDRTTGREEGHHADPR